MPLQSFSSRGGALLCPERVLPCALLAALVACGGAAEPPAARSSTPDPPEYGSVLLVTIDTLRADHLSSYGYRRRTTPFLDEIGRRGSRFTDVRSAISHTAPSHASMFTGLLPTQHALRENGQRLDPSLPTLAKSFQAAGYSTGAFISTTFLAKVTPGFQEVDAAMRRAASIVSSALEWLDSLPPDQPYFLWLHFFDVHRWEGEARGQILRALRDTQSSYPGGKDAFRDYVAELHGLDRADDGSWLVPPAPSHGEDDLDTEEVAESADSAEERELDFLQSVDQYDARITYVDSQLARLYSEIESRSERPSLWIVTSDHGEGLGSHDYWGHGQHIYDEQLKVPLIVATSDRSLPTGVVTAQTSLLDLYPTLTRMLGTEMTADSPSAGISLWPWLLEPTTPAEPRVIFSERRPVHRFRSEQGWTDEGVFSLVRGRHKYIFHEESQDELFDLDTDPLEAINRIDSATAERDELERALRAELDRARATKLGADDPDYQKDAQVMEELRALGYVE